MAPEMLTGTCRRLTSPASSFRVACYVLGGVYDHRIDMWSSGAAASGSESNGRAHFAVSFCWSGPLAPGTWSPDPPGVGFSGPFGPLTHETPNGPS